LPEIWTEYETELRDLDGGQGTRKAIEMIEEMSAIQADVEVNGSDSGDRIELIIEGYVNQIADRKSYLTRTSLKGIWDEEVSRAKSAASVDDELPTQFCLLIRGNAGKRREGHARQRLVRGRVHARLRRRPRHELLRPAWQPVQRKEVLGGVHQR